ncbi:MAG: LON peptidase substrate-binding domain-containing protein, partial [Spirochaetota bacterium]
MDERQIIPADHILPNKLLIISLMGNPIFPGIFTPFMIALQDDINVINRSMSTDNLIGLLLFKTDEPDKSTGPKELYEVGTVAKIVKRINLPDGGMNIFISTLKRFRVKKFLSAEPPITAAVEYLDDVYDDTDEVKALTRSLISEMKQISENNPLFSEEMRLNMVNIDHPGKIADFITSILNVGRHEQQRILET